MHGIPSAALWGMMTLLTSVLPLVGAAALLVPGALYLAATEEWTRAAVLLVWATLVIRTHRLLVVHDPQGGPSQSSASTIEDWIGAAGPQHTPPLRWDVRNAVGFASNPSCCKRSRNSLDFLSTVSASAARVERTTSSSRLINNSNPPAPRTARNSKAVPRPYNSHRRTCSVCMAH